MFSECWLNKKVRLRLSSNYKNHSIGTKRFQTSDMIKNILERFMLELSRKCFLYYPNLLTFIKYSQVRDFRTVYKKQSHIYALPDSSKD